MKFFVVPSQSLSRALARKRPWALPRIRARGFAILDTTTMEAALTDSSSPDLQVIETAIRRHDRLSGIQHHLNCDRRGTLDFDDFFVEIRNPRFVEFSIKFSWDGSRLSNPGSSS